MTASLKKYLVLVSFASVVYLPAKAQSLDEYKEAAKHAEQGHGCASVPFSTLRSHCEDDEKDKQKWCYEKQWECKDTGAFIENINKMKRAIDDLKSDQSHTSSDDEKKKIEEKIKDISDRREAMKAKLDEERRVINENIDRGHKCRDYRKKIRETYLDAIRVAGNESDPEKKVEAEKLVRFWRDGMAGHDTAIEKVEKGIHDCEELYKKQPD
jgi:hypothetical protein